MTHEEVMHDLAVIIERQFKCAAGMVNERTTASAVDGWDSLAHTALILKVEKAFDVRFDVEEAFGFRTVGEMAARINELTSARQ